MDMTKYQRGKKAFLWLGMLIFVLFLAGCTGERKTAKEAPDENTAEKGNQTKASDDFWQHVQEEIAEKGTVYSNDDNSYFVTAAESENTVLTQQRIDGTFIQNHEVHQLEELKQVTNEWIYYTTWEEGAGFLVFWRVPIQKTEGGDQPVWEQKEVLLQDIMDVYDITENYAIYEDDEIYRLDLQTKKSSPVTVDDRDLSGWVAFDEKRNAIVLDGDLFVIEGDSLYCLDSEQGTAKPIYTGVQWEDDLPFFRNRFMVCGIGDDSVWFTCDNKTVWQYQAGEEQAVCVIAEKAWDAILQEIGVKKGTKFQQYNITGIFSDQERVYYTVQEVGEGKTGCCLLSAPLSDPAKLQNVDAVTDYWNSWEKEGTLGSAVSDDVVMLEQYVYKPTYIAGVVDHQLILRGNRKSESIRSMQETMYVAAYDPKSGEIRERSDIRKVY